ncbi:MAG TPA: carboxypeptidase regulatory-like domain-containing protein [Candidatus Limnocylindrales bacterium]|nr:carboxypeptidase regulatory-like domain-containing protein [Candidatus Limnocylindrales bacterium]
MPRLRSILVFSLLMCVTALAGWSQTVTATILGTVTDASGAVVQNAKVSVTETQTGVAHTLQTNESGNYILTNVPPGVYAVSVEANGFKTVTRRDVTVQVDSNTRIDVQLQPGNVTETIEVTGAPPLLQTDSASTTEKIDRATLANVPLISSNRNFQSLLNLAPGVAPVAEQHSQFFNASSSLQTEVNGQMRQGNNFMIEGSDDNERTGLLQIYIPPIEAIQTVDVSLTNHDPEMGRATGAVVNVVLKSGTNGFHGGAYEFLQNSDFNARAFFNPSVGHLAYNYVGGNIGGPIKKNKMFFFSDYLRVMDHEANTNQTTIPPNPWRTGDFSTAATIIYDPTTGNPLDGTGRTPFPNNMIPANQINQISAKMMALLPGTNENYNIASPSNNYFALLPYTKTTDSVDGKIDYNVTDKDRLTGRFSFSKPVIFQAPEFGISAGGPAQGAFEGTGTQKTYVAGINYDRIVSPTLVTELRLAVSHYHNEALPSDYNANDASNLGVPGVNINAFTSGMVGIQINDGFSNPVLGYSASLPWIRAEANVDVVNTWTKTKGNHTIKWGFDLKRLRDDLLQDQTYSPRGIYYFGNEQTGLCTPTAIGANGLATSCNSSKLGIANDLASFLLDVPYQLGRDLNTYFPAYRQWEFFAFAGDKWQVSPKLTLDLGVRWEFYPPATPQFPGGFSNYNPDNNTLVLAGIGNNPSNLGMKTRYKNFAPRIGLAYRMSEKTVIRAGFGTSYTPFPDNTYAYNYPVRSNNFYNNVGDGYATTLLPGGQPATFQNGFPLPVPVTIPSNGIIPATGSLISQSFDLINLNFKNPYTETWNIAVQRSLPGHWVADLAYVGVHGVDTVANINVNNPMSASQLGLGNAAEPLNILYGKTASVTLRWAGYSSSYNSLQAKLNRRFANDLIVSTSFTYGKAMNYQTGDDGNLLWLIDQRRSYARADFDRTFNFVQSYVYQLPAGKGKRWLHSGPGAWVLGNWQLSGVLSLLTGTPFYITASGSSLNTPGETQTADQVAPVSFPKGINTGNPWFSTSSFQQPTGVRFGNTGRNIMTGPGLFSLNVSLSKTFKIREHSGVEVRAETFNFTNTPQFSNPQGSFTNSSFGFVTGTVGSGTGVNGTGGGRAVQLGARVTF